MYSGCNKEWLINKNKNTFFNKNFFIIYHPLKKMKGLEHNFLTRTTTTRKRKTPLAFKVGKAKSFLHEFFFFYH